MKCPMLTMYACTFEKPEGYKDRDCLKEECAWWDDKEGQCSWLSARFELWDLNVNLRELIEKMPREGQFRK